ncbi:MAG: GNAT family N-acetyltransferase [Methylacidiphilales bacterium]|nr:GNAT family N-acetyltransferase [Candidatus Methylacidiphilales bacterium]NJR16315.1 GNAT family N-acetyltransferase [Calothrix sp. CSU_2_0]
MQNLPVNHHLRRANVEDMWKIRKLVFSAKLEPTQLRWSNFWVIETEGEIIACGQLRSHGEVQELGSLVVTAKWHKQGLGGYLTQHLIQQATKPLYLECASWLTSFYRRFGFVEVSLQNLPQPLKRKFGFTQFLTSIFPIISLKIMQYQR